MSVERICPRATYRLQLRSGVDFDAVAGLADYLSDLAISHVHLSPCQTAVPGTTHGYDVVDPSTFDSELGGADGFARMCAALRSRGLGVVLDVVPNHMSTALPWNWRWSDVLEHGRASRFARWFDVDWDADGAHGKVVLAVLGEPIEALTARGDVAAMRTERGFTLRVQGQTFPLDPASIGAISGAASRTSDGALDLDAAALLDLLMRQHYELVRFATDRGRINYRRFFDIDGLIGLRMEDESVFAEAHALLLPLLENGTIDGLRVDHPDGLRDPQQYFERLRAAAPRAWIVAEKILAPGEHLPSTWPIDGTTGYDFLDGVGGLFVDPRGETASTVLHAEFTGEKVKFSELARRKKRLVLRRLFPGEVERLARALGDCARDRASTREIAPEGWRAAIEELIAALPVYRTYVRAGEPASTADATALDTALAAARAERPDLESAFVFVRDVFAGSIVSDRASDVLARFQQLSGPAAAKGVEDTAFYCFHRSINLCEVGRDPGHFGATIAEFHAHNARIQAQWPATMTTLATHDTKRSADVRMRIGLLAQIPDEWSRAVHEWSSLCEGHRTDGVPDRATEYMLYQTFVGAWPLSAERAIEFATKAVREAKLHTSWLQPDEAFESALQQFIHAAFADERVTARIGAFVERLLPAARTHSLAQTLLALCAPGAPDVYQGSELWDLSLTDPDNRRPVDFAQRMRLLATLKDLTTADVLTRADEGLTKMWVVRQALALRNERPRSFAPRTGEYTPLFARGKLADHVVAFARGGDVIAVAPRLVAGLEAWGDTRLELPEGSWCNHFSEGPLVYGVQAVVELLGDFPVALLSATAGRA